MKRYHKWGLISLPVFAVHIVFVVYFLGELPNKDNEFIMFYAIWGFFFGLIPLGIAGYVSHKDGEKFNWNFDG